MLSDLGSPQVTVGQQPVVDRIEEDEFGRHRPAAAASRRHEEQGARPGRQAAAEAATAAGAERRSGRAGTRRRDHGGPRRCSAQADRGRAAGGTGKAREAGLRAGGAADSRGGAQRSATGRTGAPVGDRYDAGRPAHPDPRRRSRADVSARIGGAERQGQAAAAEGGAGAGAADAGHFDRRPYRRGAVCRSRPHQLGTLRGPRQCHAASVDRIRPAGIADPQCDRQCRTRPCGARAIRWPPPTAASPSSCCARCVTLPEAP